MSEERERRNRERSQLQHEAEHSRPKKRSSVTIYLAVLFGAAFLLLLLSYFMQQRSNEQTINSFQNVGTLIDVNDRLTKENKELQEQVAELTTENADMERDLAGLKTTLENLTIRAEKIQTAMDYFWQLDEAYVRGRYGLCRDLIKAMEDVSQGSALKEYLSTESVTDTDRFSPAQRYQEIYNALY